MSNDISDILNNLGSFVTKIFAKLKLGNCGAKMHAAVSELLSSFTSFFLVTYTERARLWAEMLPAFLLYTEYGLVG